MNLNFKNFDESLEALTDEMQTTVKIIDKVVSVSEKIEEVPACERTHYFCKPCNDWHLMDFCHDCGICNQPIEFLDELTTMVGVAGDEFAHKDCKDREFDPSDMTSMLEDFEFERE